MFLYPLLIKKLLAFSHLIPPVQNIPIFFSKSIFLCFSNQIGNSLKLLVLVFTDVLKEPISDSYSFRVSIIIESGSEINLSHESGSTKEPDVSSGQIFFCPRDTISFFWWGGFGLL